MLSKDKVLSLRDLALAHLPKVRAERDRMKAHSRFAALKVVAIAPIKTSYDASSTAIENRAAVLLNLVHQHPDASIERLYNSEGGSENVLDPTDVLMKDALRNQPMTEACLLETAKLLCELSGAPLPPWMTITPEVEVVPDTSPSGDEIPGKMPQTNIGKLSIKAAWEIECCTNKRATAKQVIEKLQAWTETEPELTETIPHGVKWATTKGKQKPFDVEACAKALETWQASRA